MNERNDIDVEQIKGTIDFGIITMREDEFAAVLRRFPRKCVAIGGEARYNIAEIPSPGGPLNVAIIRIVEQGHGPAQLVFRLRHLVPTAALRAARARSTFSRISLLVAVQVKGLGWSLCSARYW